MTGRGAATRQKTLAADLKKVTQSDVIDIPKELLAPIVEASRCEDDRPEIMKHLRECLAEPSGQKWRRVHAGLLLVDALVKNGPPSLFAEVAEGRHFDLTQRLSFLERFESTDKRVMNMIQGKAETLRKEVVSLLESASLKDAEDAGDTASTCSPGASSTESHITTTSSATGFGSDDFSGAPLAEPVEAAKRTMILNNIVAVGHNDDTTSESEGGENEARAPVQYREPRKLTARARNERSRRGAGTASSDSDAEARDESAPSQTVAAPPAQTVNLLDF